MGVEARALRDVHLDDFFRVRGMDRDRVGDVLSGNAQAEIEKKQYFNSEIYRII